MPNSLPRYRDRALVVIALVGLLALGIVGSGRSGPTEASHTCINPPPTPPEPGSCGMDAMSVDMNITGNTSSAIGTIQACARVNDNNVIDADEATNIDLNADTDSGPGHPRV